MKSAILVALILSLAIPRETLAQDSANPPPLKEIGILTTYAGTPLDEKEDYRFTPFIVRLGFDLDARGMGLPDIVASVARFFGKQDLHIPGYTEFLIEPFVSAVFSPDSNYEAGVIIAIKYAYPLTSRFHLYSFGGGGVMYLSQHTREQSTQYNFTPQVGTGMTFLLKDDLAFNVEYRYRHLSNANLKEPNKGINVPMILAGVSLLY